MLDSDTSEYHIGSGLILIQLDQDKSQGSKIEIDMKDLSGSEHFYILELLFIY